MNNTPLKYALYARVASIPQTGVSPLASQMLALENNAEQENLNVTAKFQEAGSGCNDQRKLFQKMIAEIRSGTVNAILTRSLERLSRGEKSGRLLLDLMDEEKLVQITTLNKVYRNTLGDRFMLNMAWLTLEFESTARSRVIKRGLRKRKSI